MHILRILIYELFIAFVYRVNACCLASIRCFATPMEASIVIVSINIITLIEISEISCTCFKSKALLKTNVERIPRI